MSSTKEHKRLRFSSDVDLALLREFITQNPLEDPDKWEKIQENVYVITGKKFSIRTLKDHLFLISEIWLKKDTENQKKSGVEDMYSERDHLLQEVSDICRMFEDKPSNTPKRKITISKEKQIANLGRLARENCALQLTSGEQTAHKTTNSKTDVLISLEQNSSNLDHDYFLNSLPTSSSTVGEIIIEHVVEETAMENINIPSASEVNNTSIVLQKTNGEIGKVDKKAEPRILGPIKSKQNKSSGIRRSALDYLKNKEDRDSRIKAREMDLEERKLQLEERKIKLEEEESRHELEMLERKERWELEKEKLKQDLLNRRQNAKIIEYQ